MTKTDSCEFFTRLFSFYKVRSEAIQFPEFVYIHKSNLQRISCFEQTCWDKSTLASLHVMHPQARKLLSATEEGSIRLFQLAKPLTEEMNRSIWQVEAPGWALPAMKSHLIENDGKYYFTIRIKSITAILFPTDIVVLFIDMEPAFKLRADFATTAAKMILNTLYRMKNLSKNQSQNGALIQRVFADDRQKKSVLTRIGSDEHIPFISGLCGQTVRFVDLIHGFLSDEYEILMGDRFIINSFLNTSWDGDDEPFSEKELIDLARLARAESDQYLPEMDDIQDKGCVITHTFKNIVFALFGEGVACWVKPKQNQEFLRFQFKERYQTIYLQFFLLALHQRYALVDLSNQLDASALFLRKEEIKDENALPLLGKALDKLNTVRINVANFYFRSYFQQPAILSNHQQFYHHLQQVLGINELLTEVQQTTTELDYIIRDAHQQKLDSLQKQEAENRYRQTSELLKEIRAIIRQQEQSSHTGLLLTLIVEFVGIPYYLHSFLVHAFHCPNWLATGIAIFVTAGTMVATYFKFKKAKEESD